MRPLIGITTGEIRNLRHKWAPLTYGQSYTYSDAVIAGGGLPLLIPITENMDVLKEVYNRLDGILFAGGNDINAEVYNQKPYPKHGTYSDRRDAAEIFLMNQALKDDKPMLAICRGEQLLNVVLGGDLYQDIPTDLPEANDHQLSSKQESGLHLAHKLRIDPESRLAAILKTATIGANTHHHQAVKTIGESLRAVAWSEDEIIEAIEKPDHAFCLGLQCHLESLTEAEPAWLKVFQAFTTAAKH